MWSPTHVQVTVQKAKGLISKGKNGTNDAFVTISLGKEKFQTSVKEKAKDNIEWRERCELLIPKHGNRAEVVLTVLHHNFLGADEFLGCVCLPLAEMDVYKRPQNKWFKLKGKAGKENKDRGELEAKIAFTVKAGSLSDLTIGKKDKHKSSLGQISQAAQSIGGSLISISSIGKRKGLKTFATKIGKKIKKPFHHHNEDVPEIYKPEPSKQVLGDADPGVISEAESDDFALDDLSHDGSEVSVDLRPPVGESVENVANSRSELSSPATSPKNRVLEKLDWKSESDLKKSVKILKVPRTTETSWSAGVIKSRNSFGNLKPQQEASDLDSGVMDTVKRKLSVLSSASHSSTKEVSEDDEIKDMKNQDHHSEQDNKGPIERIIIGKEITRSSSPATGLSPDLIRQYDGKSREDLIEMVVNLQARITIQQKRQRDLEDYLDNLLLRVMETSPRLLQNPYNSCKSHV